MIAKGDKSFMTPEQQLMDAAGHYVNVAHKAGWADIDSKEQPLQQSRYAALPLLDTALSHTHILSFSTVLLLQQV
jgi:hypothetical protein